MGKSGRCQGCGLARGRALRRREQGGGGYRSPNSRRLKKLYCDLGPPSTTRGTRERMEERLKSWTQGKRMEREKREVPGNTKLQYFSRKY